ncbi:1-phosphofructokinase [Clostridium sp. JS66]|uniref:1-phosphofructokinase n=1 Tax=Clostridium sp. JS66 TaxID=3064705 RepID=UPI00298E39AF|nr:1-phosphofructokinase [Clostridium sp. JS66]WPC44589.1 1-phosphofructokinase [Clostridium sp. JS66]
MIITVTLNPAVDKTIEIDNFCVGTVNRISSARLDAGGKGINVSKVIQSLGGRSRAVGILAGNNGRFIKEYLDSMEIENDFVFIDGETRVNTKVVDRVKHTNTDINESGPQVSDENLDKLSNKLYKDLGKSSLIVFSGSVPQNVDKRIYKTWIEQAKDKGIKTILDADGELFKQGIKAGPYLVKPNINELEALFAQKINSVDETLKLSRGLLDYGIEIVVVSLGADGALFVRKNSSILAKGIKVEVKSTVGAGDSMVAALALAIDKGYDFEKAVRLSVACGTASVMTSGTQAADLDTITTFENMVEFQYINY